jgi:hypothetical protein
MNTPPSSGRLRRQIEEAILPLATSVDGRRFELQASLHGLELEVGGYVVLESGDERRLGQVVALELARVDFSEVTSGEGALELRSQLTIRAAHGEGVVLDRDGRPFHDALVHPADPADVAEWLETTPAPESHSLDRRAPAGARRAGHARCRRIRPTYVFVWPVRLRQDLFAGTRPGTAPRRDGPPSRHPRPELRLRPARRAADRCRRAAGRRLRRGCDRGRRPKRRDGAPTRSRGARSERACGRTGARPGRRPRGVRARRRDARRARGVRRTGENQTSRTRGRFASEPRTSAFRAGSCGPAAGLGRSSTMSSVAMPAVSSSISALWRHARSKPSPRRPCSQRSGGGGPIASPSSS